MKKYTYIAVWFVVLLVIAGALLWYEGDLLWKAQQLNLFLCTSLFFREQLVVPGGLLTWVGTFFTQFFYWPWVGVSLLGVPVESAPGHVFQQKQDTWYFDLPDHTWLTVLPWRAGQRYCWYR